MTAPRVYSHPIKRPAGCAFNARFEGGDDRLMFCVDYVRQTGCVSTAAFRLFDDGEGARQQMCIADSVHDIEDLDRDALVAHIRMTSVISKTIPGSSEWTTAMAAQHTAVGTVNIGSPVPLDDASVSIEFQRGATANKVTHTIGITELMAESYSYDPGTQLLVIPGSVEKEYPTYHHDVVEAVFLTSQQRQDIVNYVEGLTLWI